MRVIIAGGRDITEFQYVEQAIKDAGFWGRITYVICGGATGVDDLGKRWANENAIPCVTVPARWDLHGISAGPKRNKQMAAVADALVLVWDGKSKGSASLR